MNFKRIGRALVCLLLVCCLCFNMVTVPAKASVLGQTLWILGECVIASIIKGCSVEAGEAADDFNQVVSQCWADIKADVQWYEWILGDEFMLQKFEDEEGKARYYVQLTLLEAVRQWLFDSGTVSSSAPLAYNIISTTHPDGSGYMEYIYSSVPVSLISFSTATHMYYYIVSSEYFNYYTTTDANYSGALSKNCIDAGSFYYKQFKSIGINSYPYEGYGVSGMANFWGASYVGSFASPASFQSSFDLSTSVIGTEYDLVLRSLLSPSVSFATGYQDWTANSVTVEAESDAAEDEVYYPLALGQTYEETVDMTQEDVWAGNSTYVEVTVDSEITADSVAATPWATFTQWISAGWAKLETAILSIPTTIINGIRAIFVPAEDFVTVKVTAIQMEFPFIGPILEVGEFIGNQMSGFDTSPPIIYIDLGATRGSYDIGGKVAFIDMTWYAEYKPTVDTFLSALLWIVFWWKMFKRLPGLISGMPGDFVMDGLHNIGLADHLPSRNAAFEIQRRDNHNSVWRRR